MVLGPVSPLLLTGFGMTAAPFIGAYFNTYIGPSFDVSRRGVTYEENWKNPNLEPSLEFGIALRNYADSTGNAKLRNFANQTIRLNGLNPDRMATAWLAHLSRTPPPVSAAVAYLGTPWSPPAPGSPEEETAREILARNGYHFREYIGYYPDVWRPFSQEQLVWIAQRRLLDQETLERLARNYGLIGAQARDRDRLKFWEVLQWMYAPIPGISDLLRFQVREAFDERIVKKYRYDDEYPAQVEEWLSRQGLGYILHQFPGVREQPAKTWGQIYWRAHWELPSPTQAMQMLVLNRKHRAQRFVADLAKVFGQPIANPDEVEVTPEEVLDIFKVADYAPYWRKRLLALAYSPITQRFLQQIVADGVPDQVPLVERVQDLGFLPTEAEPIAAMLRRRGKEARANKGIGLSPNRAKNLFLDGVLSLQDFDTALAQLEWPDDQRRAFIRNATLEAKRRSIKVVLRALKRSYLLGAVTRQDVINMLRLAGADIVWSQARVDEWDVERRTVRRQQTVAQLFAAVQYGIMTRAEVREYLIRLGYSPTDAQRILATGISRLTEKRIRQLLREAKAAEAEHRRRLREAERRQREVERIARQAKIDLEQARKKYEEELKKAQEEYEKALREAEKQAAEELGGEENDGGDGQTT